MAITEYKFGWDDQQLEIPLLKHLIDPTLYAGDYYVESLQKNFSSFFYPILAKFITVEQVPGAYFLLYLISRYFLVFWIYKIWLLINKEDRFKAFICTLVFILMTRVDEFVYRTFSHQEFALAIIFGGIYFFFKERYLLTAAILGVAANLHALYAFFPMFFMGVYLLFTLKENKFATLVKSTAIFIILSLPFSLWAFGKRLGMEAGLQPNTYINWMELYQLSCPQNFMLPPVPFPALAKDIKVFLYYTQEYIFLIALVILNIVFNREFRTNKKAVIFTFSAFGLLGVCFAFTYLKPTRFVLDLNLLRNTQYLLFLLMGYTAILVMQLIKKNKAVTVFGITCLFVFLKYGDLIATASAIALMAVCVILSSLKKYSGTKKWLALSLSIVVLGASLAAIVYYFNTIEYVFRVRVVLVILLSLLTLNYFIFANAKDERQKTLQKNLFIIIPFVVFFLQFVYYRFEKINLEKNSDGFWQIQRSWEDMQRFAKANTPKNAMILVPYDMEMGGFRIFSNRKVVVCYRDCGIVGFDYNAAVEWKRRLDDVEPFKATITESPMSAIQKAIIKYGADYIVFVRYAMPQQDSALLERMYLNEDFALYHVVPNPVIEALRTKLKN